ncbi:hypothetical protein S83_032660 [Arachis hypogaea]|uniref:Uncharacterized protein n=1 Tax=Arachis hypogaea TaxID=3818 RepID=A0A445B568_ARAHY|nr:Putative helicase [Arachis hypogaea]RYR33825.1 hypothetical protein Ahy_A10g048471 [Arachis hypogaea]
MEINYARVAAEEVVAKNSNDLFEQFDVTRNKTQNFKIQSLISALSLTHSALNLLILTSHRKLGQTGQSSNFNDVKVGNKKHAPMKKQTPVIIKLKDTSVECLIREVTSEKFWHHPVVTLRVITLDTYAKVMTVVFGMKFDISLIASTGLHELFV